MNDPHLAPAITVAVFLVCCAVLFYGMRETARLPPVAPVEFPSLEHPYTARHRHKNEDRKAAMNESMDRYGRTQDEYAENRRENQRAEAGPIGILPLGDRIVVAPDDAETKTQTGILIPQDAQEKPQRGRVLSVGEGRTVVDRDGNVTVVRSKLRPGDRIIYSKYAGGIIVVEDTSYLVLSEKDVLAIVVPTAPVAPTAPPRTAT